MREAPWQLLLTEPAVVALAAAAPPPPLKEPDRQKSRSGRSATWSRQRIEQRAMAAAWLRGYDIEPLHVVQRSRARKRERGPPRAVQRSRARKIAYHTDAAGRF